MGSSRTELNRRAVGLGVATIAVGSLAVVASLLMAGPSGGDARQPRTDYRALSVAEALQARSDGELHREVFALSGWWSYGVIGHSCAPPRWRAGELELWCLQDEWAITEQVEPAFVTQGSTVVSVAQGPKLQPWLENPLAELLIGEQVPGVGLRQRDQRAVSPIVVLGHFDDPRSSDCPLARRQICLDRFVVDRVVRLDERDIGPNIHPRVHGADVPLPEAPDRVSSRVRQLFGEQVELLFAVATTGDAVSSIDSRVEITPVGTPWYLRVADWSDGTPRPRTMVVSGDFARIHWDTGPLRP